MLNNLFHPDRQTFIIFFVSSFSSNVFGVMCGGSSTPGNNFALQPLCTIENNKSAHQQRGQDRALWIHHGDSCTLSTVWTAPKIMNNKKKKNKKQPSHPVFNLFSRARRRGGFPYLIPAASERTGVRAPTPGRCMEHTDDDELGASARPRVHTR